MSSPSSSTTERRPFQFSLAAAFTVVTGLCIILSLIVWDANVGTALAILIVGSLWTLAAVRSGYRRLAYHLASFPLGVIAYGLLSLPISPVTRDVLSAWDTRPLSHKTWPHWYPVLMMCLATYLVAIGLRRWIRRPGRFRPVGLGLGAIPLTAAVFGWCSVGFPFAALSPVLESDWGTLLAYIASGLILVPVFSLIIGALSLHVAWPAAILFCVLLRWIDPKVQEEEATPATPSGCEEHGAKAPDAGSGSDAAQ